MPTERLARSGSQSLFGSAFAAFAALGLTALVGNGLGAHGTGVFFQAVGIFTIASQVLRLGTNSSIVKMISEQRAFGRVGESWRTVVIGLVPVILVAIIAAVAVAVFATPLATWLGSGGERSELAELLRDMAPFIVLGAALAVLQTTARMLRGVWTFTLLQSILQPLSRLFMVLVAIVFAWNALDAFRAWMAVIPFWVVITIAVLARPLVLDWRQRHQAQESTREAVTRFWAFSSTRAVGGALETALEWSDVLIVAALRSPTEAGIYAVATRTVRAGQVVDRAMRLAVSPTISEMLARSELTAARTLHTSVTRAMILSNWPYYLILATMGPAVLSIFGPEFAAGSIVLVILAGAMMVSSSAGMLQSILLQGGRSSWQMYNKAVAFTISVGGNLLLVPVLGLFGAAITWAAGILVETAIASWQVHRRMGVHLQPGKLGLAMLLPLVVFGGGGLTIRLVFGSTFSALILGVLILGIIYLALLWLLRERLGIISIWREIPVLRRFAAKPPSVPDEITSLSPDDSRR
ncbi:lipopolysaccharide biosynthesis protein [Glaciibacter psychrotolerans]|uniref:O-antigen/teichoic acid export membrane protein n=1 Tax=Glaciibacter psychrotolerans TaxID=670054 RepID=A0A7Z0EGV1_9MICO|nr:lipopolysaccharide biosynthesis protein [Leifsonia psychrotolerans]NYJ21416.1 O-antigen/teichoic acid export membrane protein [Leifsonia psychrotolerans]